MGQGKGEGMTEGARARRGERVVGVGGEAVIQTNRGQIPSDTKPWPHATIDTSAPLFLRGIPAQNSTKQCSGGRHNSFKAPLIFRSSSAMCTTLPTGHWAMGMDVN